MTIVGWEQNGYNGTFTIGRVVTNTTKTVTVKLQPLLNFEKERIMLI